jgi:hypothetical protein
MVLILDTALCDLKRNIDRQSLQEKHISAADTKKANKHKAEKMTACTRKPLLTIPTDNARSAIVPQQPITQSMTATTRRKNICMSDADKSPWDHSVAITATEYIDEPNNNSTSWNKATSNAEAVDATDSIDRLSNNSLSQNSADLTTERTTKENNGTAVKDADRNDETNNDIIFWSCTKDDDSIHTTTQKSDNDQENPITNATVPPRATPLPDGLHSWVILFCSVD